MKTPIFDGSTNLEQALDIMPIDVDADFDEDAELEMIPSTSQNSKQEDIHDDISELYDRAITAFDENNEQIENMDPKYVARSMEVNRQYLDTALAALKLKQSQVQHTDKMTLETNKLSKDPTEMGDDIVLVGDRNKILAELLKSQQPAIEVKK